MDAVYLLETLGRFMTPMHVGNEFEQIDSSLKNTHVKKVIIRPAKGRCFNFVYASGTSVQNQLTDEGRC